MTSRKFLTYWLLLTLGSATCLGTDLSGDCVAQFKFNENTGESATDNVNSNVLSFPGSGDDPAWASGHLSYCLDFYDPNDSYVLDNTPTASIELTGDMSISAWVYADSYADWGVIAAIDLADSPEAEATNIAYRFYVDTDGYLACRWEHSAGTNVDPNSSDSAISTGTWTHIVWTRNVDATSDIEYFIDANSVGSASGYTNPSGGSDSFLYVGGHGAYADSGFDGKIDNLMIFNKVLDANEINYLYNGGSGTEDLSDEVVTIENRSPLLSPVFGGQVVR